MDRQLTVVATAHAVAAAAHGLPHEWANVTLADWQTAFVAATVFLPFAAAWVAGRRPRAGSLAFSVVLAASVVFGVAHHWMLAGADNVENVECHAVAFEATAVSLAVIGAWGVLVGYSRSSRWSAVSSVSNSR